MAYTNPVLFSSLKPSEFGVYLSHCGYDVCSKGYSFGPADRDIYLIHFVLSGKGTYVARRNMYHIATNQAFIIYPHDITTYTADPVNPWSYAFFAFGGPKAEELISRTDFADGNMVISLDNQRMAEIIKETALWLSDPLQKNKDIYGLEKLMAMFRILMDACEEEKTPIEPTTLHVQRAIEYMQEHFTADLRIEDLAETLKINRSYLCRIFKTEIGMSPVSYLNNLRVEYAKKLLIKSKLSVTQVAYASGFTTFSSFYRSFKSWYDISPSKYRAQHRKNREGLVGAE